MDFFEQSIAIDSFRRIRELLSCGIFSPRERNNLLLESAFIEMIILMRHLMAVCEQQGHRINFTDDVNITPQVADVSDAIRVVRDAICHLDSPKRFLVPGHARTGFVVYYGRVTGLTMAGIPCGNAYDDDVCCQYGTQNIYIKRHIQRALDEADRILSPLISQ